MEGTQEKRNKNVGMLVSIGVHALLLLLFAFLLAWRAPDPPLPEYGIEINFGVSETGSGDIQPETPPVESESEEEAAPEEASEETPVDEAPAETVPDEPVTEAAEVIPEPVKTQQESPQVVKEEAKPVEKPVEKPKEQPKKEPAPEPVKEQPNTETEKSGAKGTGESQDPPAASQGDDTEKTGDKGDEQGELDARALYGKPGGGQGGASLNIVGWTWDEEPRKKDSSNENGTVTFEFMIDEDGYVIFTKTLKSSVSPSVAKFYEDQLKQVTFSRTGTGAVKPGNTRGTVTFTIVSK